MRLEAAPGRSFTTAIVPLRLFDPPAIDGRGKPGSGRNRFVARPVGGSSTPLCENWALDYRRGNQQCRFCNARAAQSEGGVSPLRDAGSPDHALRYLLARFVAEVLRSTIVGSVRFGVIPLDQQDDPAASLGCDAPLG
jgi:hypothetical protein